MKSLILILAISILISIISGPSGFLVSLVLGIIIFATRFSSRKKNQHPSPSVEITIETSRKSSFSRAHRPYFVGPGSSISVAGYDLLEPLIYVVDDVCCKDFDASVLELRRRIGKPQVEYGRNLPYWPKLSEIEPHQVGNYLHWLSGGRKDPNIEIGYVFIYFYGLERRALVENQDVIAITKEVVRLIGIYKSCNSFCQYASNLIVYLLLLRRLKPTDQLIDYLLKLQGGFISEELYTALLGYLAQEKKPMSPSWAFRLAKRDERTVSSVVVNQIEEEFKELFAKKYSAIIHKMVPQLGSSKKKIKYHAASPSLSFCQGYDNSIPEAQWLNIISWKQQFKTVVEIYNNCIEELRAYSRKKTGQKSDLIAAFDALPPELKEEREHPLTTKWNELLDKAETQNGITLVTAGKISELRSIPYRPKLTITQSKNICELVDSLGARIEPDARCTNRAYIWGEYIAIIKLLDEQILPNRPNYQAVNILLPLAMDVSLSDGAVQIEERMLIKNFLSERFMLTANESTRLDALIEYYLKNGVSQATGLKQKIASTFSEVQRHALGKFLVDIATASESISSTEKKILEQTFKFLGLSKDVLDSFIEQFISAIPDKPVLIKQVSEDEPGEAIPSKDHILDMDKIRQIRIESMQASQILVNAMSSLSSDVESEYVGHQSNVVVTGETSDNLMETQGRANPEDISMNIRPFYLVAITKSAWSTSELQSVARECGTTLSAGIEEINNWADEHLGDFLLIDDGDVIHIRTDLLEKKGE